jgi:hypothetical protein
MVPETIWVALTQRQKLLAKAINGLLNPLV